MKINEKTWPLIEARINQIYEKEKIKFTQSKIHGQKPSKRETGEQKRANKTS